MKENILSKKPKILQNISYTLLGNIVAFLASTLVTFIVPKQLGVESFGYFQLYLLYSSYTGFLHFGWADGVFLRYGGEYYDQLNKERFSGQFRLYTIVEFVFGISLFGLATLFVSNQDKSYVFRMLGILVIIHLPRTLLQYILQGTNRIKEYATLVITERIIYVVGVLIVICLGIKSYIPMIYADLVGKGCACIYAIWKCRDILVVSPEPIKYVINEAKINILVGSKLMFANIASFLILGFVRLAIEERWDVATFGKVSLTISVSNLLMLLIRAIALVMFPMLRRMTEDKLVDIYRNIRICLMIPLLGMLIFYYPVKEFLVVWLPNYAESLKYMAILFPMCIYESKMSVLVETYMKTMRMEKRILFVNVTTVILSIILTVITVYQINNLDLAILTILILLAFRCVVAEIMVSRRLQVAVIGDIILELILTIAFVVSSWLIGGVPGLIGYVVIYIVYIGIKYQNVLQTIRWIRKII